MLTRILAGLAVATFITAVVFWLLFKKYNVTEEQMNKLEDAGEKAVPAHEITAGGGLRNRAVADGGETGNVGHTTGAVVGKE